MTMKEPFIGSVALASGALTRHALRTNYVALHHDVYIAQNTELTGVVRAKAAWLRSRGHGVVAGFSASALHGAKWIDPRLPSTIIDTNRRRCAGLAVAHGGRFACNYPVDTAVPAIDALARQTRLKVPDIELAADRHPARHGLQRAREAIRLVDPGAESPRETALCLRIVRAGYPPPETQLPVYNECGALIAEVDMVWRDRKLALHYDGDHHRSPKQFAKDVRQTREMIAMGWIVIRVIVGDTEATILRLLADAWARPVT